MTGAYGRQKGEKILPNKSKINFAFIPPASNRHIEKPPPKKEKKDSKEITSQCSSSTY